MKFRYLCIELPIELSLYEFMKEIKRFELIAHCNEQQLPLWVNNVGLGGNTNKLISMNSFAYLAYIMIGEYGQGACPKFHIAAVPGGGFQYYLPFPTIPTGEYYRRIATQYMTLEIQLEFFDISFVLDPKVDRCPRMTEDIGKIILEYYEQFRKMYTKPIRVQCGLELIALYHRVYTAQHSCTSFYYPYEYQITTQKKPNLSDHLINLHHFQRSIVCVVVFIHSSPNAFDPSEFQMDPILSAAICDPDFQGDDEIYINAPFLRTFEVQEKTKGRNMAFPFGMYLISLGEQLGHGFRDGGSRGGRNLRSSNWAEPLMIRFPKNCPNYYVTVVQGTRYVSLLACGMFRLTDKFVEEQFQAEEAERKRKSKVQTKPNQINK